MRCLSSFAQSIVRSSDADQTHVVMGWGSLQMLIDDLADRFSDFRRGYGLQ